MCPDVNGAQLIDADKDEKLREFLQGIVLVLTTKGISWQEVPTMCGCWVLVANLASDGRPCFTLAHETPGADGWRWDRMYLMTLPIESINETGWNIYQCVSSNFSSLWPWKWFIERFNVSGPERRTLRADALGFIHFELFWARISWTAVQFARRLSFAKRLLDGLLLPDHVKRLSDIAERSQLQVQSGGTMTALIVVDRARRIGGSVMIVNKAGQFLRIPFEIKADKDCKHLDGLKCHIVICVLGDREIDATRSISLRIELEFGKDQTITMAELIGWLVDQIDSFLPNASPIEDPIPYPHFPTLIMLGGCSLFMDHSDRLFIPPQKWQKLNFALSDPVSDEGVNSKDHGVKQAQEMSREDGEIVMRLIKGKAPKWVWSFFMKFGYRLSTSCPFKRLLSARDLWDPDVVLLRNCWEFCLSRIDWTFFVWQIQGAEVFLRDKVTDRKWHKDDQPSEAERALKKCWINPRWEV
jgi:hypothetical protein